MLIALYLSGNNAANSSEISTMVTLLQAVQFTGPMRPMHGPAMDVHTDHARHGHKVWEAAGAGKYSQFSDYANHAPTVQHEEKPDNTRAYDIDRTADQAAASQEAYNRRLRANHATYHAVRGATDQVDPWNNVYGDSELSDEIMAVLAIDCDRDNGRKEGFVVDYQAYDDAAASVDDGSIGSIDIKDTAAWINGFDPVKYAAKEKKLCKVRAFHDIPEMLRKDGYPKANRFNLAMTTYIPHVELSPFDILSLDEPAFDVTPTIDTLFDGLSL
jgi:hypothetical protein